ncbi:DNA/RNA non-specific endonuclease [Roseateles sp. LYH14W]|uniref:DNA/RNA non-specific endonuclease n=1 Tax=Pelomonas parva TaxID=3299032 RepID=A0ABW7FCV5_9BURK
MDYTTVHPLCASQAHHIDIHLWRGPPENQDETRPIQILVNQGYVVGFCPSRLQPAWSAYRVAQAEQDVDYERPIHYLDDLRLPSETRVGRTTFGKLGNVALNVGHMTPNEVINRQFGRLAQMETFLMSNMSPQYGSLNSGVWLKLETAIREIKDEPKKDHVWVIVGPVFEEEPTSIGRGTGKNMPVPSAYFAVIVDPQRYPYDRLSNVQLDCFIIPQEAPPSSSPQDYPATLAEIEKATGLKFFTAWGRDVPVAAQLSVESAPERSRLMRVLDARASSLQTDLGEVQSAQPDASTIDGMIEALRTEAQAFQSLQRQLSAAEERRLYAIQHTMSWLLAARNLDAQPGTGNQHGANLITYKIVQDLDDRLKDAARTACNFWNRYIEPAFSVVVRLGTFTQQGTTIARAYKPYSQGGVRYGVIEFNTKYLATFSAVEIAGTIAHEIGHTLGIGWEQWTDLFDQSTGRFHLVATDRVGRLAEMLVELNGGGGTALSHWDERTFDRELMTGYKDSGEHVLPVTIDVMGLFGHSVLERLEEKKDLEALLHEASNVVFARQDEVRQLDLDHFQLTEIFETIPHGPDFEP